MFLLESMADLISPTVKRFFFASQQVLCNEKRSACMLSKLHLKDEYLLWAANPKQKYVI